MIRSALPAAHGFIARPVALDAQTARIARSAAPAWLGGQLVLDGEIVHELGHAWQQALGSAEGLAANYSITVLNHRPSAAPGTSEATLHRPGSELCS